jgi:hypothetical protein
LNITLTTSAAEYYWVNPIQVWALGRDLKPARGD